VGRLQSDPKLLLLLSSPPFLSLSHWWSSISKDHYDSVLLAGRRHVFVRNDNQKTGPEEDPDHWSETRRRSLPSNVTFNKDSITRVFISYYIVSYILGHLLPEAYCVY
jgi:hypothetical protein